MKSASFPSLRVDPDLRDAAEACLEEGETISAFIEESIRENIQRRVGQREFLARGLAARADALKNGTYIAADAVLDRLEGMLTESKGRK
jgi:hypothetical protein